MILPLTYHLPERRYTNDDFFKEFPQEKVENYSKLGIEERRIIAKGETASDLACKATENLFKNHPELKDQVNYLIFCAQELDHYTPSTAVIMQERLGLSRDVCAFDFNHGCSGYPYGMFMAKSFLNENGGEGALFLTGYTLSNVIHAKDKSSRFLFGDAGSATFISREQASKIGKAHFHTIGSSCDTIIVSDGFARNPITEESTKEISDPYGNTTSPDHFYMNGIRVFSFAIKEVPKAIDACLEKNGLQLNDIDLFICHQANAFMLNNIQKKLGVTEEKFPIDLKYTGNTGQTSIPIVLSHLKRDGKLKSGMRLLLVGFGTGLSISVIPVVL